MNSFVMARAFANIAIIKYWGKRDTKANIPATPSIGLAIDCLKTETRISRLKSGPDQILLNDIPPTQKQADRIIAVLDQWRDDNIVSGHFMINSVNYFPTGAGAASSASGFAALTTALSGLATVKISKSELSRLARMASGSAARSITGGLSALPIGDDPAARQLSPPDQVKWGMVFIQTADAPKDIGSRRGMRRSQKQSPYFSAWVKQGIRDYRAMLSALRRESFKDMGTLAEANCLAMHACMMATRPSLIYWNNITLRVIESILAWRKAGLQVYFTIDAGPNIFLIGRRDALPEIASKARKISGVMRVTIAAPAGAAEIIECH